MAEGISLANVPNDVREKLRELDAELAEGDLTQKGYEKKKERLLAPYLTKNSAPSSTQPPQPSPTTAAERRSHRQLTRNSSRYHSEIRQEAVMQALAHHKKSSALPMNSKRTSGMDAKKAEKHAESSSDDDSSVFDGDDSSLQAVALTPASSSFQSQPVLRQQQSQQTPTGRPRPGADINSTPPPAVAPRTPASGQRGNASLYANVSMLSPPSRDRTSQAPQPPDVTSNTGSGPTSSSQAYHAHAQSVRSPTGIQGLNFSPAGSYAGRGKVSTKMQQLLSTIKRPASKVVTEYSADEDQQLQEPVVDPNAPRPEGTVSVPTFGEPLVVPSGLPRNLEAAIEHYGSASFKATAATVLDAGGKTLVSLTYAKLLSRANKIAYNLLNKVGTKGTSELKTGDRVAVIFSNDDPLSFMSAFYGCLTAGLVPVPVEVPTTKRDAGGAAVGGLLESVHATVALTSAHCYKTLPRLANGEMATIKGWPKLQWLVCEQLSKPPKQWSSPPRPSDDATAYIESAAGKDGRMMGVKVTRGAMLCHCCTLTVACSYTEGEVMVCVMDFKQDVGLWHGILTSVFNGMHVVFVPYSLMKVDPAAWLKMVTRFRASVAVVKSRDMHWALLAQKDHKDVNLSSLRLLLVADGANPWSLTSCDSFLALFQDKGLKPEALCPCASSAEALTVSIRRPGRTGANATGRGVLSMQGLSYGVVRVDTENSLTSLTLQDCGQILPGGSVVVVRLNSAPYLCKTDEVGELCVSAPYTGSEYWGQPGGSNNTFKMLPLHADGRPIGDVCYIRTGLLGFLGPGGLAFVCGSIDGLLEVSGRRHNTDDIIATVLAVEPMKFIYRGRIAIFAVNVLKGQRIISIVEQRPDCSEEESFQWMSRVLQAVESIHQVNIYCLALVPPNSLPRTPLGGVHLHETKARFLEGSLHPVNLLMCPHSCVTNLPKPRERIPDVMPSAIQGARLVGAHGRDVGYLDEDSDTTRKYQFLSEILRWRAQSTPDHVLFSLVIAKGQGQVQATLTCVQLHKRVERVAALLLSKARIKAGDTVAVVYPPGTDLIVAVFACLYIGVCPVTIRPPHGQNIATTLPTVRTITEVSKAVAVLSTTFIVKMIKSKEGVSAVEARKWPPLLDTDDPPKVKNLGAYRPPSADATCYIDFSVSTTGMLAGIKMSHSAVSSLCRSIKLQCELYPSRDIVLSLDPYSGLGFVLWCFTSIYSGHHSILIPPAEVEQYPALWLQTVGQHQVRDTFCSYGVMELCTKGLGGASVAALQAKGLRLMSLRTCCVISEERPRISLISAFIKQFSSLGLPARAVSTSFGCRVNIGLSLQGVSSPESSTVYVDTRALRNDRITFVEKGAPHSLSFMESGKLLPGVKMVIANPETKTQCSDSQLGEIWVTSPHNASGYFSVYGDENVQRDHFEARLTVGDTQQVFARTGFLGFIRHTELTESDGERHDAVYVVGCMDETIMLRGLRYHPTDIENSVLGCHRKISECSVFTWTNLLVVVVELDGNENEALDLIPLVTNVVLEEHYLIVGVVVVVDPGVVPVNSRGEKQRLHLRDGFLADQLDPIYVAYNI